MFIFILQTVWLFIGELAGKGLDVGIILKFLLYTAPKLIPLVLPLSILVSSIMTFGRFAESYEFAAMKSTGISLQRAMRSLIVFILLLGVGTFFFGNNIIPWSEFKQYNLRKNLAKKKPALAISEGMFNDIADINIKVDRKYGENDRFLDKVIIHQKSNDRKNRIVIKSKNGELKSSPDSDILQMVLFDGNRYEDVKSTDPKEIIRRQHAKVSFDKYIMNVDLRDINKVDLEDEKYSTYKMFKVRQLNDTIKSFERQYDQQKVGFGTNMYKRTGIVIIDRDTTNLVPLDSLDFSENVLDLLTLKNQKRVLDVSISSIKGRSNTLENTENRFKRMEKKINHQKIYLHDKFAVAIACIILFFVGAPLGAIIRKGGIGLPMVVAICLFLVYHFIGIFGKNSAEDGSIPPWLGTWLSTMIMFPLSIYLTHRATSDQGLFSFSFKGLFVKPIEEEEEAPNELAEITAQDRESTDKFTALSDTQLMDVVKNYRQYNYSEGERSLAIGMLEDRGISQQRLKVLGVFENKQYNRAIEAYNRFNKNAKKTFIFYIPALLIDVALPILDNNIEMSFGIALTILVLAILVTLAYIYYFIKSIFNYLSLHEALNEKLGVGGTLGILLVGLPLYFLVYLYTLRNAKEKIKQLN
jgi:lipopolysaccharide export system permease protein